MIKGFKHMKMATIITLSVAVISLLCLSCLYLVMTSSVTRTSKQGSIDNMYTALDGQANMSRSVRTGIRTVAEAVCNGGRT